MTKTTTTFPERLTPLDERVDLQAPKALGATAKVVVQETARKLPLYDQSISCPAKGQDEKGKEIEVNSVGRWLFGVPGFQGHIRIVPEDNQVSLYYPKQSPKVVHELISSLKEAIEKN